MYMVSFKNELKEAEEAELTTETLFQKGRFVVDKILSGICESMRGIRLQIASPKHFIPG